MTRNIRNKIEGNILITTDTNLYGMIEGNVTVNKGVIFNIYGSLIGNLMIQKDSVVYLYGSLHGNINNRGFLEIHGFVRGNIFPPDGKTVIKNNARIENN